MQGIQQQNANQNQYQNQNQNLIQTRNQDQSQSQSRNQNRILLVIPAYNEAESIVQVTEELIHDYPELDYIIITDGSTDGTDQICRMHGYHAIHLPVNLGLAGCFQTGMKYAYQHGYGAAVQFDGDGQHRPEYISAMKEKLDEGYDIVLGSRFLCDGADMKLARALGSRLIRFAIRCTTGVAVTDPTCGLRMYSRRMIDSFANKINYAPEPDTISFLIKNGARVAEVPVRVAARTGGVSYLRPMNAARYMLRMLTSILLIQNFRTAQ